jgi:hypothetical protein
MRPDTFIVIKGAPISPTPWTRAGRKRRTDATGSDRGTCDVDCAARALYRPGRLGHSLEMISAVACLDAANQTHGALYWKVDVVERKGER